MQRSAIVVDTKDNVATALKTLAQGESISVEVGNSVTEIILLQAIPFGHKFALKNIPGGNPVVKYGETIGLATEMITAGRHVHVHNVEGTRGRGDRQ